MQCLRIVSYSTAVPFLHSIIYYRRRRRRVSAFERTFSSAMSSIRPDSIVIVGAVLNVLLIGLKFGTSLYCESAALLAEVRGKTNQYVCKQYKDRLTIRSEPSMNCQTGAARD